ncbi:hypothetical protein L0F63_002574 [Massospora cicadina]|nr:hypothetical protein L0F63_002574 [Massospora cicadina]
MPIVAIDANGDLYQWGSGYFGEEFEKSPVPELTLKGKDIAQVAASDKKVFALSRRGELYVISSSKKYQGVPKENQAQSWPEYLWGGEKIKHISAGQHHLAAITSNNRILTLQADAEGKKYGQLGVGNLDSATVPTNHFDNAADFNLQFNEVELPDSVTLDKVACGSNHTLIRTSSGRQLGIGDFTLSKAISAIPQEITSYFGGSNNQFRPKILDIAAGGDTSAFVVHQLDFDNNVQKAELYTCGFGQWGQLGASEFGRDVYTWGQNANFQLGTGKRNNLCAPAPPLLPNYSQTDGPSDPNVLESLQGRLQVASPAQVTIAFPKNKTKQALVEQEIVAGFGVSALYSKIIL